MSNLIEKEIERIKSKVEILTQEINISVKEKERLEVYLTGLEFALKTTAKVHIPRKPYLLRPNSELSMVRGIIKEAGKPLHIDEILQKIGNQGKAKKSALAGTLRSYSNQGKVFVKTPPNTFGLLELNHDTKNNPVHL